MMDELKIAITARDATRNLQKAKLQQAQELELAAEKIREELKAELEPYENLVKRARAWQGRHLNPWVKTSEMSPDLYHQRFLYGEEQLGWTSMAWLRNVLSTTGQGWNATLNYRTAGSAAWRSDRIKGKCSEARFAHADRLLIEAGWILL